MRYGSVCSGIEAATVAWHPLGWRPQFFAEIEPFPSAVLAHHYPHVPNLGDMTKFKDWPDADLDVLVGGTPCQSFSVAGLRKGLADPRGNLALTFLALLDRYRPEWFVWENVPGVLSSNGGRDFGAFIGGVDQLRFGWAYRVIDAQYVRVDGFGRAVPQRRRRVFVVGNSRSWTRAAAVLFEPESLSWNSPPRREAGEGVAPTISSRPTGGGGLGTDFDCDGGLIAREPIVLMERGRDGTPNLEYRQDGTANAILTPNGGRGGMGVGAIAFNITPSNSNKDYNARETQRAQAVTTQGGAPSARGGTATDPSANILTTGWAVRRLTPRECERLQAFLENENTVRILICRSEDEKRVRAKFADPGSQALDLGPSAPVAVHVLIDLERSEVRLLSLGKSPWSASIAELASSSRLPMPADAFARLAALMHETVDRQTRDGKVESPSLINPSSQALHGSASAALCGQEIAVLASDAEKFTSALHQCSRSITSDAGPDSPPLELTFETLCCCASVAIAGFIPAAMKDACSYEIRITTHRGYTLIPWRKGIAADGPRYKALGNSMAVNVMRWIGTRIDMVRSIISEQKRDAA